VKFELVGTIEQIETIAAGPSLKMRVELHWYEAHGIGRRDFKIKAYLNDES
jgi:hypothetical protein